MNTVTTASNETSLKKTSQLPRLLLFDIDGTLLHTETKQKFYNPIVDAINATFSTSIPDTQGVLLAGFTDRWIIRQLLEYNQSIDRIDLSLFQNTTTTTTINTNTNINTNTVVNISNIVNKNKEDEEKYNEQYEEYILKAMEKIAESHMNALQKQLCVCSLLPHVDSLLKELSSNSQYQSQFCIGLLSGNTVDSIPIKFDNAKLHLHYFQRYSIDGKSHLLGGFGSDAEKRSDLVQFAKRRYAIKLGIKEEEIGNDRLLVIGDTPRDIECAHANKVACVAVATGAYSKKELENAGADIVLDSFENLDKTIHAFQTCQFSSETK